MKALRTNFPYDLNENPKVLILGAPIGIDFYPIVRSGEIKKEVNILKFLLKEF